MGPPSNSNGNASYGSVSSEEGKCSDQRYEGGQMRWIVTSSLHQQQEKQGSTEMPPFTTTTPDEQYYYPESRQQWRRIIVGVILVCLLGGLLLTKVQTSTTSSSPTLLGEGEFDYIVVGGGPSGIIAATKLAKELPSAKIVLMESGSVSQSAVVEALQQTPQNQNTASPSTLTVDPSGRIQPLLQQHQQQSEPTLNKYDMPLMWSGIANTQRRTTAFQLTPDPQSSTFWPIPLALLARGLGGCGLHNAMIYIRSLPSCFQRWNMPNWTFDQMLPVYKSLEKYTPLPMNTTAENAERLQHRGLKGPIRTTPSGPQSDAMGDYFIQSALASGLKMAGTDTDENPSFNHIDPEDRIGAGYYEFNTRNGVRDSIAAAMLGNKEIPSNLRVLSGHTVAQILWSNADNLKPPKAIGVTFLDTKSGERGKVLLNANKASEVILAAGAIMTPQILWNSGIGDGGDVVHLPGVGKGLQDHPVLGMAFQITREMTKDAPQMYAVADEMEDYKLATQVLNEMEKKQNPHLDETFLKRKQTAFGKIGILGTPGFSAGAFLRSPWAEESEGGAPDIQLTVFPRVIEPHQPKSKDQINVHFMRAQAMLVTVALLEAEARYEVRPSDMNSLNSPRMEVSRTHPLEAQISLDFATALQYPLPSIQLPKGKKEYLTEKDVKRLAWGMEQVRHILRHPPMSNITTTELYPGEVVIDDGHTLDNYIRVNHLANSHWAGSTKMGRDDDPLAVLDESLRVRGVKSLRVVDSGAFPFVPNGNTHSTVCAVASRGVDLILADRELS